MTSLYVIASEYRQMIERLESSDLDPQTIADTIEGAQGEIEAKATNVAMFMKDLEAQVEAIKNAQKMMEERRKAIEAKAQNINKYLFENMKRTGISKIACPYFEIAIKKNPPSVVIEDEAVIEDKYIVTKTVHQVDKTAIKEALKAGQQVAGARLEQGERLEIK